MYAATWTETGGLTYEFSNSTEGPAVAGRVGVEIICAKLKWEHPLLITQHCGHSHKNDYKGSDIYEPPLYQIPTPLKTHGVNGRWL